MKPLDKFLALALVVVAAAVLAACGNGDSTATGDSTGSAGITSPAGARTVTVRMADNRYSPSTISAKAGETVSFEFVNDGALVHEAFIGSETEQEDHAAEMQEAGPHAMHMSGDDLVRVDPGGTATITKKFDQAGTIVIGCHQPGHWEAGMKATVDVT